MSRDRVFPLLLLGFLLSGLTALVYETAWTREFAFVFGTSELAVATVLAAYMGGLASGAAIAGRLSRRLSRPVLVYGYLELLIALAALAVPFAIAAARSLYVALFGGPDVLSDDSGGSATAIFYVACSFVILLLPTAMMGATLPVLARYAVHDDSEIGRRVGLLYGVNTAGAVAGTLLAAFVLLPAFGLRATIWIGAGINALIFVGAWALARTLGPLSEADTSVEGAGRPAGAAWILPLIGISGAVSFGYEILWVRLLAHLVGGSVHAFATMLASFLGGIALGSALASRWATDARRAATGFALVQLGIAALALAAFAVVDEVPGLGQRLASEGWSKGLVDTVACMLTLFPAALCIGATFPLAVRILARGGDDASPATARVYSANTVGSIVGSIGAAFYLVPGLGFAGAAAALAATNLALAALASLLLSPRRPILLACALVGGVALAFSPPETPWRMLLTTPLSGQSGGKPTHLAVGRSATVMVTSDPLYWHLRTNGLPEASVARPGSWPNRYMLARWLSGLPVLARPETRSMMVIGLGGGTAVELVPSSIERIDVIELEPEVVEANRMLAGDRWRDPLSDPRLRVHVNDARNALLLAEKRFDAIVSQPSHPFAGGAAHLYTREFFDLASSRLSPDGVFLQWIGLAFVDEPLFRSLLAALSAAFPHVQVYQPPPGSGVLFLASNAPIDIAESAARGLAANPGDFAQMGLHDPEQVVARLVLDEDDVRALAEGVEPNRDGHNQLQVHSADVGDRSLRSTAFAELRRGHEPLETIDRDALDLFYLLRLLPAERAERVGLTLEDPVERKLARALAGIADGASEGPRALLEEVLAADPRNAEARAAMLRVSSGKLSRGVDPATLVEPPLRDAERAVTDGWRLLAAKDRAGDGSVADADDEELSVLDALLASVSPRDPLADEAARERITWRLRSGSADRIREAVALADDSLGDSPDAAALLLRAEAYAAVADHAAVLETLEMMLRRVDAGRPVSEAYRRRAVALLRATPAEPELVELRRRVQQRLRGR